MAKAGVLGVLVLILASGGAEAGLVISGVIEFDDTGGTGTGSFSAIELFATADIPDLSVYGVETPSNSATFDFNAGATDSAYLSGSVSAGDFIHLVWGAANFDTYFAGYGFAATGLGSVPLISGDDGVGLWYDADGAGGNAGALIDVYGADADTDWYHDEAAVVRVIGTGPGATFDPNDWSMISSLSGPTGLDDGVGFGTYGVPEPATLLLFGLGLAGVGAAGRRRRRRAA
jgi:hypothetical protein